MDSYHILQLCLKEVEEKLNWGNPELWTNSEFKELSKIVFNASGISLSVSSLRRLFGKSTDYKKVYNPQRNTKNALCIFLGYKDWTDFKRKRAKLSNNRRWIKTALYSLLLLSFTAALSYMLKNSDIQISTKIKPKSNRPFVFYGENLSGEKIPHTVRVRYNTQNLKKPLYIDWGDTPEDGSIKTSLQVIENDSGTITHTFFNKSIHKIQLKDRKDKVLKEIYSFISTKEWECYVKQNDKILHIDSSYFYSKNKLCPQKEFLYNNIDSTQEYRAYYRNNKNFNVDGNRFVLNSNFYPIFRENYVECAHLQIEIFGTKGTFLITFVSQGCSGEIRAIYLNNNHILGATNDLSDFTVVNKEWQNLSISTLNNIVAIKLNDNLIMQKQIDKPIGKIIGIRFEFKGNGCLSDISIDELK